MDILLKFLDDLAAKNPLSPKILLNLPLSAGDFVGQDMRTVEGRHNIWIGLHGILIAFLGYLTLSVLVSLVCGRGGKASKTGHSAGKKKTKRKKKKKDKKGAKAEKKNAGQAKSTLAETGEPKTNVPKRKRKKKKKVNPQAGEIVSESAQAKVKDAVTKKESGIAGKAVLSQKDSDIRDEDDGWVVQKNKKSSKNRKKKNHKKSTSNSSDSEDDSVKYSIPASKIGQIIGPGGSNLRAIQDGSGCTITLPRRAGGAPSDKQSSTSVITLAGGNVGAARAAIADIIRTGSCVYTRSADYTEVKVSVHPQYFSDIIGQEGRVIRKIRDACEVQINMPSRSSGTNASQKITINGPAAGVRKARELLVQITKVYHTEVTHPGLVHAEMSAPKEALPMIIGKNGMNVRHLQNDLGVRVHIPNEFSVNKNVVIVGTQASVANASRQLAKIIADVNSQMTSSARVEEDNDDEEWVYNDDGDGWD
eukprot:g1466.t1